MNVKNMEITKLDKTWTINQAISFIKTLNEMILEHGYHAGIIGSVINNGTSNHDLDIVILPFSSDGKHPEVSKTGIRNYLVKLGATYNDNPDYEPAEGDLEREIWKFSIKDRDIDFFLYD